MEVEMSPSNSSILDSSSRRKHRRSPEIDRYNDDDEVEELKVQKDHRHHHRRRHHRHNREKKDKVVEEEVPVAKAEVMDEDREEGEILEDEEGGIGAGAYSDHMEDGAAKASEMATLVCSNKSAFLVDERKHSDPMKMEDGEISPSGSTGRDRLFHSDGECERSLSQGGAVSSRWPTDVSRNDKRSMDSELKVSGLETKWSPEPRRNELSDKRKRRDDADSARTDYDLERHKVLRRSKSRDTYKNHNDGMSTSVSPGNSLENHRVKECSPSYVKHHGEERIRGSSTSRTYLRERSHERNFHTSHVNSSESKENMNNYSDRETIFLHDKLDRHDRKKADMEKYMPSTREHRSTSHGRCDGWEDRAGSQDRNEMKDREGDKTKERARCSERERDRDSERERDRGSERERDRGRERARDRGRHMDRDRERSRDVDKENDNERTRGKDIYRDRERTRKNSRDSHRNKSNDLQREKDRDLTRCSERNTDSRNSRYSRYDDSELRPKEPSNRSSSFKHEYDNIKKKSIREEDEEDYQEKIEQQLAEQEEEDPEKIIEESRRRREAILEKYKKQQSQQNDQTQFGKNGKVGSTSLAEDTKTSMSAPKLVQQDTKTTIIAPQLVVLEGANSTVPSAAEIAFSIGKSPQLNGISGPDKSDSGGLGHGAPKSERSADIFCDDIFGDSPTGVRQTGKDDNLAVARSGLHDNWDDAEGYYSYRFGEVLDGRYEIIAAHGKGVFSTVVRAKDLKAAKCEPVEVAIKIIRSNDTMYKAGLEELVILKKLAGADPEDKRHCVRFISSFKYRNHLCLVFESLHMNLREVLKKFGRNIGLKLTAVRAYAKQLFIALKHLRNCGVLHCDIKPDNMLVNEAKNVLKLCDFGNAMFAGKNEITPYLVSRFYRSPEIILGLPYDHPMDMWSVGCCLFELYNGKVLFPGPSNNDMLRLHMELKGSFPKKMLRKGAFTDQHFDHDLNFHATEEDPVTKKPIKRLLLNIKPKDMGAILTSFPEEDPKMLGHFKDLLDRIFVLDPEKRLTVSQALCHPFITGK